MATNSSKRGKRRSEATTTTTTTVLLSGDVKERLETLSENVSIVTRQIKSGTSSSSIQYSLTIDEFHARLHSSINILSSSCTNLSVLLSNLPCPSLHEVGVLCAKIETTCLTLSSTLCQCRLDWGKYHLKEVQQFVVNVLNGVSGLAKLLMTEGCKCDSKSRLQGTGSVWEYCDRIAKLPMNNKRAVVKVCLTQLQLLRDANTEVDELASSDGVNQDDQLDNILHEMNGLSLEEEEEKEEEEEGEGEGDGWSSYDKPLVNTSIELIKLTNELTDQVCHALLQYTDDCKYIEHLDHIADWIVSLSPLVDEIGSELEAPINHKLLQSHCLPLSQQLLDIVAYLSENDHHQNWNNFKLKLDSIMVSL